MVVSAISKSEGKLFRAEGLIFASPERLFSFLYDRLEEYSDWTSIWSSCKVCLKGVRVGGGGGGGGAEGRPREDSGEGRGESAGSRISFPAAVYTPA